MTDADAPSIVTAECGDCGRRITVHWPPGNPDDVGIRCTGRCGNAMIVTRDGEVVETETENNTKS